MRLLLTITKIILLTSLAVWLNACGGGGESTNIPSPDFPNSVTIEVDPAVGAVLSLNNSAGDNVTLTINPDSLLERTEITLTGLKIPPASPFANVVFPGVSIIPDGVWLRNQAQLRVELDNPPVNIDNLQIMLALGPSKVAFLDSSMISPNVISANLDHFSIYIGAAPTSDEIFQMIANIVVSGGDLSLLSTLELIDDMMTLYRLAEGLDRLGEIDRANQAREAAGHMLNEAVGRFATQVPADPCGSSYVQLDYMLRAAENLAQDPILTSEIQVLINGLDCINIQPSQNCVAPGGGGSLSSILSGALANETIAWSSSNDGVVTVDQEGNYSGQGIGNASITAQAGNSTDIVQVQVSDICSQFLQITPANLCIDNNQIANFSVIGGVDISQVTWTSSDVTVAVVDDSGLVTANGLGPAQIIASAPTSTGLSRATANIEVKDHCVTISASDSGLGAACMNVASSPAFEPLDNTTDLEININSALQGYGLFWESSNEQVATVVRNRQLTSTVTAHSRGSADIRVTVDNIVTQYQAAIPVMGKVLPDDYTSAWLTVPLKPLEPLPPNQAQLVAPALKDERQVLSFEQIKDVILEAEEFCGISIVPYDDHDKVVLTDFNMRGQFLGYISYFGFQPTVGWVFDAPSCSYDVIDAPLQIPQGSHNTRATHPWAINENGTIVGSILQNSSNTTPDGGVDALAQVLNGFVWENGVFKFPGIFATGDTDYEFRDINNNGVALGDIDRRVQVLWRVEDEAPYDAVANLRLKALNDYGHALGNWTDLRTTGDAHLYSKGVSHILNPVFPIGDPQLFRTFPGFVDINNADDLLAVGQISAGVTKAYVMYLCPFPIESGSALWIEDPDYLEGYEALEVSCDGRDNDLNGFIDVPLVAQLTAKQQGVCAATVQQCNGTDGWVNDYSNVAGYEFPELSCDGLDNDCDGIIDEGCS